MSLKNLVIFLRRDLDPSIFIHSRGSFHDRLYTSLVDVPNAYWKKEKYRLTVVYKMC